MKDLLFQGAEDLLAGIGITFILAAASAVVQVVFGGWKGFRHAVSILCVALFTGVMAQWGCQYYSLPWVATALITVAASLFSYNIMAIIFHPEIRQELINRIKAEIRTRGRSGNGAGE